MPEYPHGTPSWVELNTPDQAASAKFYGDLFGWGTTEPGGEETGGYQMFTQDEKNVAGLMKIMQPQQPVAWATYIQVDDADKTAADVAAAGGQAIVPVMDVMDIGRMAFFLDPTGAAFGVWQAKSFTGADLVNEPNSLCWNDVMTRDAAKDEAFYGEVFGWSAAAPSFDESGQGGYKVWSRPDGGMVGGMMQMTDEMFPAEVPAYWAVCFAVADTDAIVTQVTELGGQVTAPAMDCPIGRFAGFLDPQGAAFTVMQMSGGAS
jgi:hypothetical protein